MRTEHGDIPLLESRRTQFVSEQKRGLRYVAMNDAINKGDRAALKKMLDSGYDPDQVNLHSSLRIPILHRAVLKGDLIMAKMLIDAGADVDAQDKDGWTPLIRLVADSSYLTPDDRAKMMDLLVSSGADVDAKDAKGCTALHYARHNAVKKLVELGADVTVVNSFGNTPLDVIAVRSGSEAEVEFLRKVISRKMMATGHGDIL